MSHVHYIDHELPSKKRNAISEEDRPIIINPNRQSIEQNDIELNKYKFYIATYKNFFEHTNNELKHSIETIKTLNEQLNNYINMCKNLENELADTQHELETEKMKNKSIIDEQNKKLIECLKKYLPYSISYRNRILNGMKNI